VISKIAQLNKKETRFLGETGFLCFTFIMLTYLIFGLNFRLMYIYDEAGESLIAAASVSEGGKNVLVIQSVKI
jgi:hypothetical protein